MKKHNFKLILFLMSVVVLASYCLIKTTNVFAQEGVATQELSPERPAVEQPVTTEPVVTPEATLQETPPPSHEEIIEEKIEDDVNKVPVSSIEVPKEEQLAFVKADETGDMCDNTLLGCVKTCNSNKECGGKCFKTYDTCDEDADEI